MLIRRHESVNKGEGSFLSRTRPPARLDNIRNLKKLQRYLWNEWDHLIYKNWRQPWDYFRCRHYSAAIFQTEMIKDWTFPWKINTKLFKEPVTFSSSLTLFTRKVLVTCWVSNVLNFVPASLFDHTNLFLPFLKCFYEIQKTIACHSARGDVHFFCSVFQNNRKATGRWRFRPQ